MWFRVDVQRRMLARLNVQSITLDKRSYITLKQLSSVI